MSHGTRTAKRLMPLCKRIAGIILPEYALIQPMKKPITPELIKFTGSKTKSNSLVKVTPCAKANNKVVIIRLQLILVISSALKVGLVYAMHNKLTDREDFIPHPDCIIHSDQGMHYTHPEFQKKISQMGIHQSMSRLGKAQSMIKTITGKYLINR